MTELVIATRGSQLALWQAEHTRAELLARDPDLSVRLLVLKTQGDKILDRALSEIGGKGLFTKEIEDALLERRADVAVHSMKDVPAAGPEGLVIAAVPERADPRDALLLGPRLAGDGWAQRGASLVAALSPGTRVAAHRPAALLETSEISQAVSSPLMVAKRSPPLVTMRSVSQGAMMFWMNGVMMSSTHVVSRIASSLSDWAAVRSASPACAPGPTVRTV